MAQAKLEDDLAPATWLSQTARQIQVLDYERHATLRITAAGETLDSAQKRAFIGAVCRRARLMTSIVRRVMGAHA